MRTKNAARISASESHHLARVKGLPCAVCGASAPSEAHHIEQGLHFATIPLCMDCHRGSHNGIHGRRSMWNVMRKTELSCLNQTIKRLAA